MKKTIVIFRTLFWQGVDGRSSPESLLPASESRAGGGSWAPDGRTLVFEELNPKTGWDLATMSMAGDRKPTPFLQTSFNEHSPKFSPDGRWLAYVSDESGQNEVYVQPYPGPGRKWRLSTDGGRIPRWARDGRELFYRSKGGATMGAKIKTLPAFSPAQPRLLFRRESEYVYDVGADGRFLMIEDLPSPQSAVPVTVVLNWLQGLQRRLSFGR